MSVGGARGDALRPPSDPARQVSLCALAIAVDHRLDESYTPAKLSVRAGTNPRDLKEIAATSLDEPSGWVIVPLHPPDGRDRLAAHLVQVAVISNHQNGRDTHVRSVRVFAPRPAATEGAPAAAGGGVPFGTAEALQWASVR